VGDEPQPRQTADREMKLSANTNEKGGIIDDVTVYKRATNGTWL
jgi:glycine cleavage system aminomethyltransferase T